MIQGSTGHAEVDADTEFRGVDPEQEIPAALPRRLTSGRMIDPFCRGQTRRSQGTAEGGQWTIHAPSPNYTVNATKTRGNERVNTRK